MDRWQLSLEQLRHDLEQEQEQEQEQETATAVAIMSDYAELLNLE